ncbi:YafY family transcriptional regulator [Roseobacter denitrificans]|uniref:Transcriptional regulator n=1 Tax=Roseobacter denitrificans (strain ATCC 33942 / OCh 114) TaxID=375451 RepID=Q168M0_ROSDO|nr:YafY family protein [Roseobacter denitrificans]ABG31573.1 conserved hypothetical protein [Roseobacter denitrificans OCh 114]AVL54565.1 YafY family transcriptional regulator [Roseobacter denitrificans]SFF89759.1 Predicted DNA-binding transcriptional regulator YafY, contains an HTH and WYL domains [Roseobacter denitrificans OCh 114]
MARSDRLFEIIQLLRAAPRPMTADVLADCLEVSKRTVYRDIATLQARQTPIDGAPGIGYMMRAGYDLPPLNFDAEEIDALRVGLAMLVRTGDSGLEAAAGSIRQKVDALHGPADWLQVSPWGAPRDDPAKGCVSIASLRSAIRDATKLKITYRSADGTESLRVIRPLALIYHLECVMVAGWCELRTGFRHFRTDRIYACVVLEDRFAEQSVLLRQLWGEENQWGTPDVSDEVSHPTRAP